MKDLLAGIIIFGTLSGCTAYSESESASDETDVDETSYAVGADKTMPATYAHWQLGGSGAFDSIEKLVRPVTEPAREIFFAQTFAFQSGIGGYIGLQRAAGGEKRAIFSIWNNTKSGAFNAESPGVANTFGNEGTGWHTHVTYPWVADHIYRLRVVNSGPGAYGSTRWTGYVSDASAGGTESRIGTIYMSWDTGRLGPYTTDFVEHFAPQSSCAAFGSGTVYFGAPSANGGTVWAGNPTNEIQSGAFACPHVWTSILNAYGAWAYHGYAP